MNLSNLWQFLNKRLKGERTYIVPTKLGLSYGFLCVILLSVAFIYNNNVAYFSCFLLTSIGLITMFQTNFNMERVSLTLLPPEAVHAAQPARLKVLIENRSTQPVYQIDIILAETRTQETLLRLAPKHSAEVELTTLFTQRGYHPLPTFIAETTFPFGLLRSWKLLRPKGDCLVFPAKKGSLLLPTVGALGVDESRALTLKTDHGQDFVGHRPFQSFDSYRHIDWKAYARNQKRYVKLFESEETGIQLLSWNFTDSGSSTEERVSQLAQWISVCQRQKLNFVLELPGFRSSSDNSDRHINECLTQLALFQPEQTTTPRPSSSRLDRYRQLLKRTAGARR